MNKQYTLYYTDTGTIKSVLTAPEYMLSANIRDGIGYVEGGFRDDLYYFDFSAGAPKLKPEMGVSANKTTVQADGVDSVVISGLPTQDPNGQPIEVRVGIGSDVYAVTDGVFEFTVDAPGTYRVMCRARNYLDYDLTVEAI